MDNVSSTALGTPPVPNGPCAVAMTQSGGVFNVGGTFFVPHGIMNVFANAGPTSGQVIADTLQLQGGSSSLGGAVAYKGSLVAPVPGAAVLFE